MAARNHFQSRALRLVSAMAPLVALLIVPVILPQTASARPLDPITPEETAARLVEFTHVPWGGKAAEQSDGSHGRCKKSRLTLEIGDPVTGTTRALEVTLVRPESKKRLPAMILVPTIEGPTAVERSIMSDFCDLKVATILADVNANSIPEVIPSWGSEDRSNLFSVRALRTIIDYATQSAYFDPQKVGLMGSSLGAITGALMAGIEPERLNAIVLVVGGVNLSYILSVSDNDIVGDLRRKRMRHEGFKTVEQYEEALRQTIRFDPLFFAKPGIREKLFVVMAASDDKVPTSTQKELLAAFGEPAKTVFSGGHVQTIVSLTFFYFDYVTDFLKGRFQLRGLPQSSARTLERQRQKLRDAEIMMREYGIRAHEIQRPVVTD